MKKKPPQAPPLPSKSPNPPAKQAPPQTAPAAKPVAEPKKAPEAKTPVPGEQGTDLSDVPVQSAEKKPDVLPSHTTDASGADATDPYRLKATVPADPIDWMAMRQPFVDRGVPLGGRENEQIRHNWSMAYHQSMVLGLPPDLSIKIANIGVPFAYNQAMARDNPTQIEKFDMDTEKMLPTGKKLGKFVVPIITPDSLGWAVEKITGKKLDFHF